MTHGERQTKQFSSIKKHRLVPEGANRFPAAL